MKSLTKFISSTYQPGYTCKTYLPVGVSRDIGLFFIHSSNVFQDENLDVSEQLQKNGFTCFTFDMQGNKLDIGKEQTFTIADNFQDILKAFDYFQKQGDFKEIIVIGSSYGGYLAAWLSGQRKFASLILRAPQIYPNQMISLSKKAEDKLFTKLWRQQVIKLEDSLALQALYKFPGRVLLISSENDEKVSPQTIKSYAAAASNSANLTEILMSGLGHKLETPEQRLQFAGIIKNWLEGKDRKRIL
ncbi:MAG: alpha/beta fold hydrolase [bacterium]